MNILEKIENITDVYNIPEELMYLLDDTIKQHLKNYGATRLEVIKAKMKVKYYENNPL